MDKIVVFFQPFAIKQNVVVYKNDEPIQSRQINIEDISATVKGFCNQYSIKNVDLKGSKDYLEKYKAEILTEYSLLNVNIV
jgi:hypothetical protein